MASSRERILESIRRHDVPGCPLPDLTRPDARAGDPVEQFLDTLEAVGATGHRVSDRAELDRLVRGLDLYCEAKKVAALVEGVGEDSASLSGASDPHDAADVDLAIVAGELAVAENAAVWVTERRAAPRSVLFLAQHLALVVSAEAIVYDMHEAYQRLSFSEPGFGVFVSGPSKTADIEQSLVIGAHGARSLHVFVLG